MPQVESMENRIVEKKIRELRDKQVKKLPRLLSRKTQTRHRDVYGDGTFSEDEPEEAVHPSAPRESRLARKSDDKDNVSSEVSRSMEAFRARMKKKKLLEKTDSPKKPIVTSNSE